jgi:hypothetical protein
MGTNKSPVIMRETALEFKAVGPGTSGQLLLSAEPGNEPSFQTVGVAVPRNLLSNSNFSCWSVNILNSLKGPNLAPTNCLTDPDNDQVGWGAWSRNGTTTDEPSGGYNGRYAKIGNDYSYIETNITVEVDEQYEVEWYVKKITGATVYDRVYGEDASSGEDWIYWANYSNASWSRHRRRMVATDTDFRLRLYNWEPSTTTHDVGYDDVYVKKILCGYDTSSHAPDGMERNQFLLIEKETSSTYVKGGRGCKMTKTREFDEEMTLNGRYYDEFWWYKKFQGVQVTLGAYVYADDANNVRLAIDDGVDETFSSFHTGDSTIQWLEVTVTIDPAATEVGLLVYNELDIDDVGYISQVMFIMGSSIGEGNYEPMQSEVIWLYNPLRILDYKQGWSDPQGSGEFPQGVQSIGARTYKIAPVVGNLIPPNCKRVYICYNARVPGTERRSTWGSSPGNDSMEAINQASNIPFDLSGWVNLDEQGQLVHEIEGAEHYDLTGYVHAVELR